MGNVYFLFLSIVSIFAVWVYGLQNENRALAGVAQWTEHQPANQRAAGLSPSQGTCLGCGPGPQ